MHTYKGTDETTHQRLGLLMEVDFKWLMAGLGQYVDPDRLKSDDTYAEACFQFALQSACAPLRLCAERLQAYGETVVTH